MKFLKSSLLALSLLFSFSLFTPAIACDSGRTCIPFAATLKMIDKHVVMAITAVDEERDTATIIKHINKAKRLSKEINENDRIDRARGRANGLLKKARSAVKKAKMVKGTKLLKMARKKFASLKALQ